MGFLFITKKKLHVYARYWLVLVWKKKKDDCGTMMFICHYTGGVSLVAELCTRYGGGTNTHKRTRRDEDKQERTTHTNALIYTRELDVT